jgi:hypothetical protein
MRKSFAVLCVAVGIVIGYAAGAIPIGAQSVLGAWIPFAPGETVRLSVDLPEGSILCKVTQVQNGFVGCTREEVTRRIDRWINLRFVKEITRTEGR